MKLSRNIVLAISLAFWSFHCTETVECENATLVFEVEEHDEDDNFAIPIQIGPQQIVPFSYAGVSVTITGTVDEDEKCPCENLKFLQVGRVTNLNTGRPYHDDPWVTDRATADGWAVDNGWANDAWYPRPATRRPPPNTADMRDNPGVTHGLRNRKFEFITCLICAGRDSVYPVRFSEIPEEDECKNKILCSAYWTFTIDKDGDIADVEIREATDADRANSSAATQSYNRQAARHNSNPGATGGPMVPVQPLPQ
ncbi:MAG: hypothetical protein NXI24_20275 [bacterium]|nr:hypothetical protein [bacterium]